jgi:hypothetical protein
MSKGSAPSYPDPYQTAQAQYQYGTEAGAYQAALNDVNTSGPTGSTSYAITGYDPNTGAPIRTQTTTLSPAEQNLLTGSQNVEQGQLGTANNFLNQVNSASGMGEPAIGPLTTGVNAGTAATSINTSGVPGIENIQGSEGLEQQAQNTALAGEQAAMQPQQSAQYEQLDASLRNAGALPGSPAYETAMSQLEAQQGQQDTQAAGAAITAGTGLENTVYGEEANTNSQLFSQAQAQEAAQNSGIAQNFSQGLSDAQLNNSSQAQLLADYAQQVGIPLDEMSAILGNTQVATPSAVSPGTGTVQAPNIEQDFANQYQAALAGYNSQVAQSNADVGAGVGIAGLIAEVAPYFASG